ncbi:MAG TPA: ATP-binding cassette domain-containing protein, partial [Anaerovoracaceae bacterium]|nr:ATP-binding cassette domain-containing protein [Anaerovoracaceae bacterium]
EHLLERKPKALSGGQRQRVALGRAMVRDPAVFLLDEPLSNLDAKLRNQMRAEISKLHRNLGTTFVYVTHDQTEAMTMGDRIVVMKDGFIQQIDTPQNLYNKPCNLFVAGFIGSPQMNFINGTIIRTESGYAAEFAGHRITLPESKQQNLASYDGKEVVFGIRPEDIAVRKEGEEAVEVKIDLVELMGSEMYLHCDLSESKLTVRTPVIDGCKADSTVFLTLNTQKIYIFDKDTETVISN